MPGQQILQTKKPPSEAALQTVEQQLNGIGTRLTRLQDLTDIEIVQAFRYSAARGGTPISLPLQDSLEKSKLLTSPHYWLSKTNW